MFIIRIPNDDDGNATVVSFLLLKVCFTDLCCDKEVINQLLCIFTQSRVVIRVRQYGDIVKYSDQQKIETFIYRAVWG